MHFSLDARCISITTNYLRKNLPFTSYCIFGKSFGTYELCNLFGNLRVFLNRVIKQTHAFEECVQYSSVVPAICQVFSLGGEV